MKKRIVTIIIFILAIGFSFALWLRSEPMVLGSTVRAVGDLSVDWGVTEGNPIFSITNMAPGQTENRTVVITNSSTNGKPVSIKGIKTFESGGLSTIIDFEIKDGLISLYSNTLDQFFNDTNAINGIELFLISPNQTKTLTFTATFRDSADNNFQNQSVVFDLVVGIAFDIPQECQQITFSQPPIFGTDNNDNLRGTNKNDLIIAFDGNDKVDASNGDDCIITGAGKDNIDASNGDDIILAGSGNDEVDASNGDDFIFGEEGNDTINGSNGIDNIFGGEGGDVLNGKNGDDNIEGGNGNDKLIGGSGNDTLLGEDGNDSAKGDLGIDHCQAETKSNCEL